METRNFSGFLAALLMAAVLPLHAIECGTVIGPNVTTSEGPVVGLQVDGVRIFRGIPYAAPPIGELRWKAPQPPPPRERPLNAVCFGPSCPQKPRVNPQTAPQSSADFFGSVGAMDEDCLYLNIWTPEGATAHDLPVFFWIHGGGFQNCSGSQPMTTGENLARRGAVVVTFNYRLSSFGFTAHPALTAESRENTSGNYGMLDMVAALRWVRQNIEAFGGNPDKITIIGQSVGGVSVLALMASPLAEGLFQRAIVHSGPMPEQLRFLRDTNGNLASMESLGLDFAKRLGVEDSADILSALRGRTWKEVLAAAKPPTGAAGGGTLNSIGAYPPFLDDMPSRVFKAGRQTDVPILLGHVRDEGTLFENAVHIDSLERYREVMKRTFGPNTREALEFYPANDAASAKASYIRAQTDGVIAVTRRFARRMAPVQKHTYVFEFARTPAWERKSWLKCFHGSDIAYLFGHFLPGLDYGSEDRRLSAQMMDYWIHFARTGDPNHEGASSWPAYDAQRDPYLVLDSPIRTGQALRSSACDFWDRCVEQE